jgi:hypothetical protein
MINYRYHLNKYSGVHIRKWPKLIVLNNNVIKINIKTYFEYLLKLSNIDGI